MSIKSSWLTMLLRSSVSLLIFCLVVPVIIESGTLKSPTLIVELSFSTFSLVSFALCILGMYF